jgi:hypothetical protein
VYKTYQETLTAEIKIKRQCLADSSIENAVYKVSAQQLIFKGERVVLLHLNDITCQKVYLEMLSCHNQTLTIFVEKFKNKVESNLI